MIGTPSVTIDGTIYSLDWSRASTVSVRDKAGAEVASLRTVELSGQLGTMPMSEVVRRAIGAKAPA